MFGSDLFFFKTLLSYWEDAETIYVHAGIDITVANLWEQDLRTLMWIRERFYMRAADWHGKQVVFGHTPTQTLGLSGKAIFQSERFFGIDTGCVYGGYLTALDTRSHRVWQQRSNVAVDPVDEGDLSREP